MNNIMVLDFETYFDKDYTIKKMPVVEYVNHPQFLIHGVGIKDSSGTSWYTGGDMYKFFNDTDWQNTAVVCHNMLFDGYILKAKYDIAPAKYIDTLCMARGIYPHLSNNLDVLAKRLGLGNKGTILENFSAKFFLTQKELISLAKYCMNDVELTNDVYNMLVQNYPESELDIIDITLRMYLEPKLVLNIDTLNKIELQEKLGTFRAIEAAGMTRKTLASRPKFVEALAEKGVQVAYKTSKRTGKLTPALAKTDKGFKDLYIKYPQYKHIFDARQRVSSRINETRAKRLLQLARRGPVGVPLTYYAAHTGRFGGAEKINFQNFPPKIKAAIEAPQGYRMYNGDLKQIEVRVLAILASVNTMLGLFRNERDIYSEFAEKNLYHKPITKGSAERFVGKTAILGLGYSMGHKTFANNLLLGNVTMPEEECQMIVATYRSTYPEIPVLWRTMQNLIPQLFDPTTSDTPFDNFGGVQLSFGFGYIGLPNGMKLSYPELRISDDTGEFIYKSREGWVKLYGGKMVENLTQALARILITDMIRKLAVAIKPYSGSIVGMVHDSIWTIAPDTVDLTATIEDIMTTSPKWIPNIPLSVDLSYGGYK